MSKDADINLAAISSLKSFHFKGIEKYVERFKRLSDNNTIKKELMDFPISTFSSECDEKSEEALVKLLIW